MNLISEVDRPGSDIDYYVASLDKLLAAKVEKINSLRHNLRKFNVLLKDEEALSEKFMGNNDIMDVYDLKNKKFLNDEEFV
jgi:kinesin family protein 2/24